MTSVIGKFKCDTGEIILEKLLSWVQNERVYPVPRTVHDYSFKGKVVRHATRTVSLPPPEQRVAGGSRDLK